MIRSAEAQRARPWERMYLLQLARFVATVLRELGERAQARRLSVPCLIEFFYLFMETDRYFRTRKTWSLN